MRNVFKSDLQLSEQFNKATEILLNTLSPTVVHRLHRGEFPISDKYEKCAVALVNVSFIREIDDLVAFHEIFSVSACCNIFEFSITE